MELLDSETVGSEDLWSNTLFKKQKTQIENMRSALMECDESDPFSVKSSMQKILVMRIYHQITRIIRYTEQMDKIENKLYQVIDTALDNIDPFDPDSAGYGTLSTLLMLQEKLQKSMIESQKLLDPYLNIKELTYIELPTESSQSGNRSIDGIVMDQGSRKKLREGAQALLDVINEEESKESEE